MNTATHLPRESSLKLASRVWQLGSWLAGWGSSARAEAKRVDATASTATLDRNCTLWVERPMGRDVSCAQGTLWLTFDGVRKDIVLEAGLSYRCDCASRLSIYAIDTARFELT